MPHCTILIHRSEVPCCGKPIDSVINGRKAEDPPNRS